MYLPGRPESAPAFTPTREDPPTRRQAGVTQLGAGIPGGAGSRVENGLWFEGLAERAGRAGVRAGRLRSRAGQEQNLLPPRPQTRSQGIRRGTDRPSTVLQQPCGLSPGGKQDPRLEWC